MERAATSESLQAGEQEFQSFPIHSWLSLSPCRRCQSSGPSLLVHYLSFLSALRRAFRSSPGPHPWWSGWPAPGCPYPAWDLQRCQAPGCWCQLHPLHHPAGTLPCLLGMGWILSLLLGSLHSHGSCLLLPRC